MRLAYLYSRYPVLSQTFCDTEMLEMERRGFPLVIGSIHPPLTSIRHAHADRIKALIHYGPPQAITEVLEKKARDDKSWPAALVEAHNRKYGSRIKAATRARNALFFADLFRKRGVDHFHVHFANRAAHTALFLKEISGIPFSVTAHGQDFMADLGNEDLLREICAAAEFVAVETEYSRRLLAERCPDSATKIHRVFNGMDLGNFPRTNVAPPTGPTRILSVGRLVNFKGFEILLDACAELKKNCVDFRCVIIGDGPLRETLSAKIAELELQSLVRLAGALPQQEVQERLRTCDIFALASVIDRSGASDIFPTVILEAMASARPVVSTFVAGIPESVIDGATGFLVSPNDSNSLANALAKLCADRELRSQFGAAGRARIEQHFRVETTIVPLLGLLQKSEETIPATKPQLTDTSQVKKIAYLIDRWPNEQLSTIEDEIAEMHRRHIAIVPFVCAVTTNAHFSKTEEEFVPQIEFLPDEMVIEAEWQRHRALAHELEDDRANAEQRTPSRLFLRAARFAIALRRGLKEQNISHVHATSSRALVCALLLQKMLGLTISVALEPHPGLSRPFLHSALKQCVGGRLYDPKLAMRLSSSFLLEKPAVKFSAKLLARGQNVWQEWSELLVRWNR